MRVASPEHDHQHSWDYTSFRMQKHSSWAAPFLVGKLQFDMFIAATGVDQGFISRIESGLVEPCLGTLGLLATAFGLSISDLLTGV
jgi:Helix-turn-helix